MPRVYQGFQYHWPREHDAAKETSHKCRGGRTGGLLIPLLSPLFVLAEQAGLPPRSVSRRRLGSSLRGDGSAKAANEGCRSERGQPAELHPLDARSFHEPREKKRNLSQAAEPGKAGRR